MIKECACYGDLEGLQLIVKQFPQISGEIKDLLAEMQSTHIIFPSILKWCKEQGLIDINLQNKLSLSGEISTEIHPVIRADSVVEYGGETRHKIYLERQQDAIAYLLASMSSNKCNFDELLDVLGRWRQHIAYKANNSDAFFFGYQRKGTPYDLNTPVVLTDANQELTKRMAANIDKDIKGSVIDEQGNTVPVTLTHTVGEPPYRLRWIHTLVSQLPVLHAFLKKQFNELISRQIDPTDPEQKASYIYEVGVFQWWWAQTCLYCRGSAAIGEVFVLALLARQGITDLHLHSDAERFALATPNPSTFAAEYQRYLTPNGK